MKVITRNSIHLLQESQTQDLKELLRPGVRPNGPKVKLRVGLFVCLSFMAYQALLVI